MPLRKVSDLQQLSLSSVDFDPDRLKNSLLEVSYRVATDDKTRSYESRGVNFVKFAQQMYETLSPYEAQLSGVNSKIAQMEESVSQAVQAMGAMPYETWKVYVHGKSEPYYKYVLTQFKKPVSVQNCATVIDPTSYSAVDSLSVYAYEGLEPDLSVTHMGKLLVKNVDYTVGYEGSSGVIVHETQGRRSNVANVVVKGINDYYGDLRVPYTIAHQYYVPQTYDLSDAVIELIPPLCAVTDFISVHSFDDVRPQTSVTMLVRYVLSSLVPGENYDVSYFNNTSAMTHDDYGTLTLSSTVVLSGIGDFVGEVSVAYPISHTYARKPSAYVQVTNTETKDFDEMCVSYNMPGNSDWNMSCWVYSDYDSQIDNYNVTAQILSPKYIPRYRLQKVAGQPSEGETSYCLKLSSSYDGIAPADNAIVAVSVRKVEQPKTQLSDCVTVLDPEGYEFSGSVQPYSYDGLRPDVTLTYGGKTLVEDVDYYLDYDGDSGTFAMGDYGTETHQASVLLEGIGDFTGTSAVVYPITYTYHRDENQRHLVLQANDSAFGTTSGSGWYLSGTEVSAYAYANDGYVFVKWTDEDGQEFFDSPYVFELSSDVSLTANFTGLLD